MRALSLTSGAFAHELHQAMATVDRATAEMTGARSPAVVAAASVLVKEARRLVGESAEEWESAPPGAPPYAHRKRLQRSIQHRVVNGVRRVGTDYFVARLLEFGTDGEERGPTAPHPFMRPAAEGAANEMGEVFVSTLQSNAAKVPL